MGGGGGRRDEKNSAKINRGDYSSTASLGVEIMDSNISVVTCKASFIRL